MSGTDSSRATGRWRALASRVVATVGGLPAARTLVAVLAVFDRAGGGLAAGGLAYAALFALLPGLLLLLSVVGLLAGDPETQLRLTRSVAAALPPLEDVARLALREVSTGAVPTGILAILGLLWGSSRFYTVLDRAFAQIFDDAPKRSELSRTVRGLVLTVAVVLVPVVILIAGSVATWAVDLPPGEVVIGGAPRLLLRAVTIAVVVILFVAVTALVFRIVPARRIPMSVLLRPAVVAGLALAALTQVFAVVAPRLVGSAAVYGTFVAVFALLIWLSLGFNVLLLGAAWTRVRERGK